MESSTPFAAHSSGFELAATKPAVPDANVAADAERNFARSRRFMTLLFWLLLLQFEEALRQENAVAE